MNKLLIYFSLVFMIHLSGFAQCTTGCTYVYTGLAPNNNTNISLNPGETLCIQGPANVSGLNISTNNNGSRSICVAPGVNWTVGNLNFSETTIDLHGTINTSSIQGNGSRTVNVKSGGTLNLSGDTYANNQVTIVNDGTVNFTSNNQQTIAGILLTNNGALNKSVGLLKIGNGSQVSSSGTITVASLENEESNSFVNTGNINVTGEFFNHGSFTNNSVADVGSFRVGNKGAGKVVTNNGLLIVRGNFETDFNVVNNGAFEIAGNANLKNSNNIVGDNSGYVLVLGTQSGSGTIQMSQVFTDQTTLDGAPFPVKLKWFKGESIANYNQLSWSFEEAINFQSFLIEKSFDAKSFEIIGVVKDFSADGEILNYRDESPGQGINYYRLRMKDIDGSYSFSKIIAVNFTKDGEYLYFENPIHGQEIVVKTNISKPIIHVFDLMGREVETKIRKDSDGFVLKPRRNEYDLLILSVQGEKSRFVKRALFR